MNIRPESLVAIYSKLNQSGLLDKEDNSYYIDNEKIRKLILKDASEPDILNIYNNIIKSSYFSKIPISSKLKILSYLKKYAEIAEILKKNKDSIIKLFPSYDDLIEILEKTTAELKSSDDYAQFLLCQAYYLKGDLRKAMGCYESHDFSKIDCARQIVDLFNIYTSLGEKEKALQLLDNASKEKLDESTRIWIDYERLSYKYIYELKKLDKKEIEMLLKNAKRLGLDELYAKVLKLMGNLELSRFNYEAAMSCYKEAIDKNKKMMEYNEVSINLNNLSLIYVYTGKYESSISILKELIESTYTTGDLKARIYAVYNLSEIYYVTGRQRYAESYIPLMIKLLDVTGEQTVAFHVHRFMMLYETGLSELNKAIEYASMAEKEAPDEKSKTMVSGFKQILRYFKGEEPQSIDAIVFSDEMFSDDYASVFYVFSAYYYMFLNEKEKAIRAIDLAEKAAMDMNIAYNIVNVEMHKAIIFLAWNMMKEYNEYFIKMKKPETGITFYDETYRIFKAISENNSEDIINSKYRIIEEDNISGTIKDLIPFVLNSYALMKITGKKDDFQHVLNVIPVEYSEKLRRLLNYS
ncbi:MAG: tetratricopeptide repeat protein [Thermoplasmata archaeon]